MNRVKIVHAADLHIDSPLMGLPSEKAAIRRDERRQSFADIIKTAGKNKADLILLPGDIFESENVSDLSLNFLKECFAKVPDIKIFIAPGNHDCKSENSVYQSFDFGSNVHVFDTKAECITIPEKNVRVYGIAFSERFETRHLMKELVAPNKDMINIGVIHGMVGAECEYNPITTAELENSNMDYVALGHIHESHEILKAGNTVYAYSGIHEGRHFDEMGECGYIAGEVGSGYTDLKFICSAKRQMKSIEIDISGCLTYDDIISKAKMCPDDIYKIVLKGKSESYFEEAVLRERLSQLCFFCKIKDKTSVTTEETGGALRDGFKALLENKRDDTSKLALKYGLRAIEGKEVGAF